MRRPFKLLLRASFLMLIAGLVMFGATLLGTPPGVTGHESTTLAAHEEYGSIQYLSVRPYEIRIIVPSKFEGALLIYDYEGMKQLLVYGVDSPQENFVIKGPSIVDFTPGYRGYYLFLYRSLIDEMVNLEIGLVGKSVIEPDTLRDAGVIASLGLSLSVIFAILDRKWSKRPSVGNACGNSDTR